MSDTPISDSTPHNVADLGMQIRRIERQLNAAQQRIKRLEEQLMDTKNKHAVLVADVALYEDRAERIKQLEDRIKQMEEAGDMMVQHFYTDEPRSVMWEQSKEAKP